MTSLNLYNQDKKEVKKLTVPESISKVERSQFLIYQAVTTQLANKRSSHAFYKNRTLVSGGGVKPWRQKGTGRARHGSIRSPIWVGGGATFGAQHKNYGRDLNKKTKQKALRAVLSHLVSEKKIFVFENLNLDKPKTKEALKILKKFNLSSGLIVDDGNENLKLAVRNIENFKPVKVEEVNVFDLLKYENLVMSQKSWEKLLERAQKSGGKP